MDKIDDIRKAINVNIKLITEVISIYNEKKINTAEYVELETTLIRYFNLLGDPDLNQQMYNQLLLQLQDYIVELTSGNLLISNNNYDAGRLNNIFNNLNDLYDEIEALNLRTQTTQQQQQNNNLNVIEQAVNNATENNPEAVLEDFIQTETTIGQTLGVIAGYATFGLLANKGGNDGFPPNVPEGRPYSGPPNVPGNKSRYVKATKMVTSLVIAGGKLLIGALGSYTAAVIINKLINYGYNDLPKYFGYNDPIEEIQEDGSTTYTNVDLKQGALVTEDGSVSYYNLEGNGEVTYNWVESTYQNMDSYITPEMKETIKNPEKILDQVYNPNVLIGIGAVAVLAILLHNKIF